MLWGKFLAVTQGIPVPKTEGPRTPWKTPRIFEVISGELSENEVVVSCDGLRV